MSDRFTITKEDVEAWRRNRFVATAADVAAWDYNECHEPAGSENGGQFCSEGGGEGPAVGGTASKEFQEEMKQLLMQSDTFKAMQGEEIKSIGFWKDKQGTGRANDDYEFVAWHDPRDHSINFREDKMGKWNDETRMHVIEHELAHVLDREKSLSKTDVFNKAWKGDVASMPIQWREKELAYFADHASEAFAEAYSLIYANNKTHRDWNAYKGNRALFEKYFPSTMEWVRTQAKPKKSEGTPTASLLPGEGGKFSL